MERGEADGANEKSASQEPRVTYYKVYEEHEDGVLTPIIYMRLKKGAKVEYPLTEEQVLQCRGFKKVDLEQLVEYRLLKRYIIEKETQYVYFLSEVKTALKNLKSGL